MRISRENGNEAKKNARSRAQMMDVASLRESTVANVRSPDAHLGPSRRTARDSTALNVCRQNRFASRESDRGRAAREGEGAIGGIRSGRLFDGSFDDKLRFADGNCRQSQQRLVRQCLTDQAVIVPVRGWRTTGGGWFARLSRRRMGVMPAGTSRLSRGDGIPQYGRVVLVMMAVMQRNRHIGPEKGQQRKRSGKTAGHHARRNQSEESMQPF